MGDERRRGRWSVALLGAALIAAVSLACSGGGGGSSAGSGATGTGAVTAAPPAGPVKHPPKRVEGSAAALSNDGQRVLVADEDHEVVFSVPVTFTDTAAVRVAPMPGPPAQIVVADDLVLVTVRTLPADDAKAARAEIRGPSPEASAVKRVAVVSNMFALPWSATPPEYQKFLDDHQSEPASSASAAAPSSAAPPASGAPSSGAAAPGASGSASAKASASGSAKAPPKPLSASAAPPATPSKPFDPNVVRRSQGGLLMIMKPDNERGLVEVGRVALPADAWGLAVTPDGMRAVVTSAWSAQVSVVDVNARKVIATLPAPREPRGVTISKDGKTAYVTHLIGTDLSKIDGVDGEPKLSAQPLPPAPARTPVEKVTLSASLAYAAVLSPDDRDLYVPRHVIGAEGRDSWWGAPAVDVLDRRTGKPVAPLHQPRSPSNIAHMEELMPPLPWMVAPGRLPSVTSELAQPRGVIYRKKTDTLLVAAEGYEMLIELDATAPDPSMFVLHKTRLSSLDHHEDYSLLGGAPTGVALSEDEDTAFVYCRTTFDLVKVDLKETFGRVEWLRLAEDGLPGDAARGRRLFTNARSGELSGGLGCAACHPEGRDDGYVWREALLDADKEEEGAAFLGLRTQMKERFSSADPSAPEPPKHKFYPRQTPMIAGRARAAGPYGWHAEAADLSERLQRGMRLHREPWFGGGSVEKLHPMSHKARIIDALADYLQSGLMPPPVVEHPLTDQEKRGKEIFEKDEVQCARCHVPATEYTDRTAYPLKALPVRAGFDIEKNSSFKTPSLYFIAGTGPYFHDGSQATLEDLIKNNGSRMGNTEKLSTEDQAALVAYLRTL